MMKRLLIALLAFSAGSALAYPRVDSVMSPCPLKDSNYQPVDSMTKSERLDIATRKLLDSDLPDGVYHWVCDYRLTKSGTDAPSPTPVPTPVPTPTPAPTPTPIPTPTPDPNEPPPVVIVKPEDSAMIAAIVAAAPAQHPTEARFAKIPGSNIDVLLQCGEFPAFDQQILCYKSYNAFIDWTGGAWNWNDWEMIEPAGGGHADYWGNEVYKANLHIVDGELSVKWSRPTDPSPPAPGCPGSPSSGPMASHTYATPVYVEKNNEYWHHTTGGGPLTSGTCFDAGNTVFPGGGGWVYKNAEWRQTDTVGYPYGRACYHRNRNMIYLFQQGGSGDEIHFDAGNNYALTTKDKTQWFSGVGQFDSAMDQARDICYFYHHQTGITGRHYAMDGTEKTVFSSVDKTIARMPSLSVEHSTGDLVIAGTLGYAAIVNRTTGVMQNISATDGGGIPQPTYLADYLYGKFDMIEKIPCIGIGVGDARQGVYLMTLPASVCTMGEYTPPPTPTPVPPPVVSSEFMARCAEESVVFCDPLSTHGPYGKVNGELVVLKNDDGTEGVPKHTWWRKWRGVQEFADGIATAKYDPEMDALKLVMPTDHAASGLFNTNFSKDLQTQFAEGDSFRLEFQVRYNCEYIYEDCNPDSPTYKTDRRAILNDAGGLQAAKLAIIGEGDVKQGESIGACEVIQIVPYSHTGHTLAGFVNCGKYAAIQAATGKIVGGSSQLDWQAGGDYACYRFPDDTNRVFADWSENGTGPNCARFEPDEWMTFAMEVSIGQWQQEWTGPALSTVKFYLGHEGQPLKKVFDRPVYLSPPSVGVIGYGKVWLQIHSTSAKSGTGRPPVEAWYRNLIVSRLS